MFQFVKNYVDSKRLTFLPSWVILIIDLLIVISFYTLSFYFFTVLEITFYKTFPFLYRCIIAFFVYLFYFLLFKTYTGIIRYSSIKDALRLFKATFFTFFTIYLIDTSYLLLYGTHIFVMITVLYTFITIYFGLIVFRVLVKNAFHYFSHEQKSTPEDLAIIGVNSTTIALAEAFLEDYSLYNLRFFIDKNKFLNGKKILGIPVLAKSNSIISILRYYRIKHVVLIKNYLEEKEELELLEDCLRYKINVYNPKLVSDFNENLNSKKSLKKYTIDELMFRETINIDNTNIIDYFKEKTIMVTGGAGSIGSEIVKQLTLFNPKKILILDQAETPLNNVQIAINKLNSICPCVYKLIDITNKEELQAVFDKHQPEVVFHAAAYKHVPVLETNFMQAIKVNVFGTKNVLDLAIQYGVQRFVYVSTDKAVNPTNIMGASKRIAEIMVQSRFSVQDSHNRTQIITTRFGNVLGSNGSVVNLFENQIREGGPVTVTHPEINRFFMTIPEACKLVLEAGTMGMGGEIYIFDMGKPIKIRELAEKMIRLSGKEPYTDIDIIYTGLRPGEKLYEEVLSEASRTLPTYNPKILIAQDPVYCYEKVERFLNNLNTTSFNTKQELIHTILELVPEFIQTPQD